MTLEDVYVLLAPLDTWSMDDMERQRRARYQKSRGKYVSCQLLCPLLLVVFIGRLAMIFIRVMPNQQTLLPSAVVFFITKQHRSRRHQQRLAGRG